MWKRIRQKFEHWVARIVCSQVAVGGWCGLCGKWIPDILVPFYCRYTVCSECAGPLPKPWYLEIQRRHLGLDKEVQK